MSKVTQEFIGKELPDDETEPGGDKAATENQKEIEAFEMQSANAKQFGWKSMD